MLKGVSSYWLLHLDALCTTLSLQADEMVAKGGVPAKVRMNIGYQTLVEQVFKHDHVRPIEVEEAIILIEDEIMRVHAQVAPALPLVSSDPQVWEIAERTVVYAGQDANMGAVELTLQRDAVEFLFNRWADMVSGSPVHAGEQAMTKEFGAQLLILRELLHHLNFEKVQLMPQEFE